MPAHDHFTDTSISKKVYGREIKKYQLGSVRIRTHADYDNSA